MLQLIPISDANPTRRRPVVTIAIIIANVLVFLLLEPSLGEGPDAGMYFYENAPVPCQISEPCPRGVRISPTDVARIPDRNIVEFLMSVIFSTFLHGGILHIAGNMLFLWVFGNNIEDFLGHAKYVAFYLFGGIAASFAHIAWTLSTEASCVRALTGECVPSVGASGAVAAVMGAYLLLFPRARINTLVPLFIFWTVIQVSAWVALGIWLVTQFITAYNEAQGTAQAVAWMAHVGGFVFGVIAIFLLGGRPRRPRPAWVPEWRY